MAEAHADGKEAFARSIATELFSDFLSVEERFAGNKEATEQEVIDSLRQVIDTLQPWLAGLASYIISFYAACICGPVLQQSIFVHRLLVCARRTLHEGPRVTCKAKITLATASA